MVQPPAPRLNRQQVLEGLDKLIAAESHSKGRIETAFAEADEGSDRQRELADMLMQVTHNVIILTSARRRI